jgi:hypothetical protein
MRAGYLVILSYLFCVIAPSFALAMGAPLPCVTDEIQPVVVMDMHQAFGSTAQHDAAAHHHDGMHVHHATDAVGSHARHSHDGKNSPGPCCAMMCVSAMPADLPSIVGPLHPGATRVSDIYQTLRSKTPGRHYRPPIA